MPGLIAVITMTGAVAALAVMMRTPTSWADVAATLLATVGIIGLFVTDDPAGHLVFAAIPAVLAAGQAADRRHIR